MTGPDEWKAQDTIPSKELFKKLRLDGCTELGGGVEGGACTELRGECDKDGEKAQHPQLSFLRNRLGRLKSPQLGELCFALKIELPAFFHARCPY